VNLHSLTAIIRDKKKTEVYSTLQDDSFALDFETKKFGRILIKELNKYNNPDLIKSFFKELEEVSEITITVPNIDDPYLDKNSFIILYAYEKREKKLFAGFFWSLLSKSLKDPYIRNYVDHYKRLERLFLDRGKEIILEEQ